MAELTPWEDTRENRFVLLSRDIAACKKCSGLNIQNTTESAPGFGNLYSKVVIIGQSLCRKCMDTHIPFTGGSGRVIDHALDLAGVRKDEIFITNVVHCHTPDNRKSFPHEISNCAQYLREEIRIINPKAIIPLGGDAIASILGEEAWPDSVGKKVFHANMRVYPLYHPSYILKLGREATLRYTNTLAVLLRREVGR